jgi:multidrug efflux pump subunit AcrA (membrane-fusion protein)
VAEKKDGRLVASQRRVGVAQIVDNNIVVTSGLTPGERIVVSGVQKLDNGVPIRTS